MSGLRFESMADMPPRMREAYARQMRDLCLLRQLYEGGNTMPPGDPDTRRGVTLTVPILAHVPHTLFIPGPRA